MDPTLFKAAIKGNAGDGDFILADHLKRDEENGYEATPRGNTVLHLAALYGHSDFVGEVLAINSGLLCHPNKNNQTALHLAVNEGHVEVVRMLFSKAGDDKRTLMSMPDDNGDTALHKAVRSQHLDIVTILVTEDPEFEFPANKAGETPLYLAAEFGFHGALVKILESRQTPNSIAGPYNRTPLLAAITQKATDCVRSLWQWNKSSCEEADKWGWNSLHYAVKLGMKEVVSDMLDWKKSLAYLPAGSDNDWTTAIHIAASGGHANMIDELSRHCPDCWEMLNSSGQNVLHVAILNYQEKVVKFLLSFKECHSLVDEPDKDGNTPLHLLAATGIRMPGVVRRHPKAKKMSLNNEDKTPLDIALSYEPTTAKEIIMRRRLLRIGRLGRHDFKIGRTNQTRKTKAEILEKRENKVKEYEKKSKEIMMAANVHLVVATLLVTVTFAACFQLPGGFDSDPNSPNKGMASLIRKTAFRAFLVSNAIAFSCSVGAVFSYLLMAANTIAPMKKKKGLMVLMSFATVLQLLAMLAVAIAFVTGMYATLAYSPGLANTICAISCLSIILYALGWGIIFFS